MLTRPHLSLLAKGRYLFPSTPPLPRPPPKEKGRFGNVTEPSGHRSFKRVNVQKRRIADAG